MHSVLAKASIKATTQTEKQQYDSLMTILLAHPLSSQHGSGERTDGANWDPTAGYTTRWYQWRDMLTAFREESDIAGATPVPRSVSGGVGGGFSLPSRIPGLETLLLLLAGDQRTLHELTKGDWLALTLARLLFAGPLPLVRRDAGRLLESAMGDTATQLSAMDNGRSLVSAGDNSTSSASAQADASRRTLVSRLVRGDVGAALKQLYESVHLAQPLLPAHLTSAGVSASSITPPLALLLGTAHLAHLLVGAGVLEPDLLWPQNNTDLAEELLLEAVVAAAHQGLPLDLVCGYLQACERCGRAYARVLLPQWPALQRDDASCTDLADALRALALPEEAAAVDVARGVRWLRLGYASPPPPAHAHAHAHMHTGGQPKQSQKHQQQQQPAMIVHDSSAQGQVENALTEAVLGLSASSCMAKAVFFFARAADASRTAAALDTAAWALIENVSHSGLFALSTLGPVDGSGLAPPAATAATAATAAAGHGNGNSIEMAVAAAAAAAPSLSDWSFPIVRPAPRVRGGAGKVGKAAQTSFSVQMYSRRSGSSSSGSGGSLAYSLASGFPGGAGVRDSALALAIVDACTLLSTVAGAQDLAQQAQAQQPMSAAPPEWERLWAAPAFEAQSLHSYVEALALCLGGLLGCGLMTPISEAAVAADEGQGVGGAERAPVQFLGELQWLVAQAEARQGSAAGPRDGEGAQSQQSQPPSQWSSLPPPDPLELCAADANSQPRLVTGGRRAPPLRAHRDWAWCLQSAAATLTQMLRVAGPTVDGADGKGPSNNADPAPGSAGRRYWLHLIQLALWVDEAYVLHMLREEDEARENGIDLPDDTHAPARSSRQASAFTKPQAYVLMYALETVSVDPLGPLAWLQQQQEREKKPFLAKPSLAAASVPYFLRLQGLRMRVLRTLAGAVTQENVDWGAPSGGAHLYPPHATFSPGKLAKLRGDTEQGSSLMRTAAAAMGVPKSQALLSASAAAVAANRVWDRQQEELGEAARLLTRGF
jgi:hypothetical protein